jgi:hypothetical protein
MDFIQPSNGWQSEILMLVFNVAVKTPYLEPIGCDPGLTGLLLGFLLLFL